MTKFRMMAISGFTHMHKELPNHGILYRTLGIPKPWRKGPWTPKRIEYVTKQIEKYKPQFLMMMKDPYFTRLMPTIRAKFPKLKMIMWYGDQRGNQIEPLIKDRIPYLHALLITNSSPKQKKMYKNAGIPFVETFYHSFAPQIFKLWDLPITHQVFFGGNNFSINKFPLSKERRNLINTLHKRFNLVVHGNGWKFPTQKWVLYPQYSKELRKAHINIGINHYDIYQYYNRRLFECVASGRLHITRYIPGMEKHFKNKEHLVWFKTNKQCIALVKYYLDHEKEREQIAKNGREFFLNRHSWTARVTQFKKLLAKM